MRRRYLLLLLPLSVCPSCHETVEMNFPVVYYAGEGGKIMEQGNDIQVVYRGYDAIEVTAVANDGYSFSVWSDGIKTATRLDKNIQTKLFVTAYFVKEGKK